MLFADTLRGWDATGVISVFKDESFSIAKEACNAVEFNKQFVDSKLDKELYSSGVAAIGHNRAKTIGINKDENAHPFVEGDTFAMVHNGTLHNHKNMSDTEVDSHALTIAFKQAMEKDDWKSAMEETLGKISGAFACVWYDQTKHQVCMIRNSQRPLAIVETSTCTLIGSEMAMLHWIALRNTEKILASKSLDTSTLYQFDLTKSGGDFSETFLSTKSPKTHGFTNGTTTTANINKTIKWETKDTINKEVWETSYAGFSGDGREVLSRNAYKRLRTAIFRKTLRFDVEDIIATSNADEFMVFGESINGAHDLCDVRHSIRVLVSLKALGLKYVNEMWADKFELEGIVQDTEFEKSEGGIVINIEGVKNVSEATVVTH